MIICYPFIIEKNEESYTGYFPDFKDIKVKGKSLEETLIKAKESLGIFYSKNEDVKQPSDSEEIQLKDNQLFFYVDINVDLYREIEKYKSVTRAVTLPKWLNQKAVESGINVSALLQRSLMEALNLKED